MDNALHERRRLLAAARVSDDDVDTLSRYELLTYLGCALDRMDRMSMATSLEGRVPFLDIPLVEHVVRMPTALKIGRRETKRVLKVLARRRLSTGVASRSKSGFGVPLGDWFRSPILAAAVERLRDPDHPAATHFQRAVLDQLLAEHASGHVDQATIEYAATQISLSRGAAMFADDFFQADAHPTARPARSCCG